MGGSGGAEGPQRGAEEDPVLEDERGAGTPLEGAGAERREGRMGQQQNRASERYGSFSELVKLVDPTATCS